MTDMMQNRAISYGSPRNEDVDSLVSSSQSEMVEIINLTEARMPPEESSPSSMSAVDKTFEVNTERGGRRVMSEEEVSSLVHNALQRARKATSSVSPRRRTVSSMLTSSKSPSVLSPDSGSVHGKPPTSPNKRSLFLPGDDEMSATKSSFPRSRISPYMKYGSSSRGELASPSSAPSDYSFDDLNGSFSAPTISTVNSSDAIIKRVEEEIANARRAAQEANRCLAGVSAGFEFQSTGSRDRSTPNGSSFVKSDSMDSDGLRGVLSISDGAPSEDNFDDVMEAIGEDFDAGDSFDPSSNESEMPGDVGNSYDDSSSELSDPALEARAYNTEKPWNKFVYRETKNEVSDESTEEQVPVKQTKKETKFPISFSAKGNAFMKVMEKSRGRDELPRKEEARNDEGEVDAKVQRNRAPPAMEKKKFPTSFSANGNAFMKVIEKVRATEDNHKKVDEAAIIRDNFPGLVANDETSPAYKYEEAIEPGGSKSLEEEGTKVHEITDSFEEAYNEMFGKDSDESRSVQSTSNEKEAFTAESGSDISGSATACPTDDLQINEMFGKDSDETRSVQSTSNEKEAFAVESGSGISGSTTACSTVNIQVKEEEEPSCDEDIEIDAIVLEAVAKESTEEPDEEVEAESKGAPYSEDSTVVAANSWDPEAVQEDGEEQDDSQSANSEEAIRGAISSPRRDYWWNKVEENEAKKREACTNETPEIINLVDTDVQSHHKTIDPAETKRAPTPTKPSLQCPPRPPSPLQRNPSPSPQRSQALSSLQSASSSRGRSPNRSASPPSPMRSVSPSRARSAQRGLRHIAASQAPSVGDSSRGRSPSPVRAPSPLRVSLMEHRRAERSRTSEVCIAMTGILIGEEQQQQQPPEEPIPIRSKKVRFRNRYPVPPLVVKPRAPLEIIKANEIETPEYSLYLAKPKKDLQELIEATKGSSLQRRSNACGALKILTSQKTNKLTLVRTEGFLEALVLAVQSSISSHDRETAIDARTRAVYSILNVCEPKDNRAIILSHPQLPECLVKCIVEDRSEARAAACGALAMLAKTPHCRGALGKVEGLIDTLAQMLTGVKVEIEAPSVEIQYSTDDENSQNHMSRSYSSDDSSSSASFSDSSQSDDEDHHLPNVQSMRQQKIKQNEEMANRARLTSCATLVHLSKHCAVTVSSTCFGFCLPVLLTAFLLTKKTTSFQKAAFCTNENLLEALVLVSREYENPIHTKCLEILCNMTRFQENNTVMAKYPGLVDALVVSGNAKSDADRLWVIRTLQNLSSCVAGKTVLASHTVLTLLCVCVMRKGHLDEQIAATTTLYNLSTEPGAVVPLTNTENVVATLVHVAHSPDTATRVRLMACDALATLGLWLQTLAGAGTVPDDMEPIPLPSYSTAGWNRWD